MSATNAKRKRVMKACIPCHQRKRKCDAVYPCTMCTAYGYICEYVDQNTGTRGAGESVPPPAKRVNADGDNRPMTWTAQGHNRGIANGTEQLRQDGASPKDSPATVAGASPGIFDEQKLKYSGASAAMAFPRVLGAALGSDTPPEVRSYAYNFGVRPEEPSNEHGFLGNIIDEVDLILWSQLSNAVLAPLRDLIDLSIFSQRCLDYYRHPGGNAAFAAVAAGTAALASFLSSINHKLESELVKYAKSILNDPASMRSHEIDYILAWGLRVLYLRLTSRPSNAWIASCTQMHLCEAAGLHEEETIQKIASLADPSSGYNADRLRRIFWFSWAGHVMLSYEYDRSPVVFRSVTVRPITAVQDSVTDQFVQLVQIIPSPNSPYQLDGPPRTPSEELFGRFKALDECRFTDPFLVVTKADIAFCFYRRLYQLKVLMPDDMVKIIIHCGNEAVKAAVKQASGGTLLWNAIGSVFQYTCILLAIDTAATSVHISSAFNGLESLVKTADTRLTREALSMARHLLGLNMAKKRKEIARLEAVEAECEAFETLSVSEESTALPDVELGIDWDQFFMEPYSAMFSIDF
ncbi:unnamed protein product [Penicillium olsonii]|nr:unnamed protein product [Penicillium olsonii]